MATPPTLRSLDSLCCWVLARHLGCRDAAALVLADPTLAPWFAHPLRRLRREELAASLASELDEAMRVWTVLLGGVPRGGSGPRPRGVPGDQMAITPLPVPGTGFAAAATGRDPLDVPVSAERACRWAKKVSAPRGGWPALVWISMVVYDFHDHAWHASVSAHPRTDYFDGGRPPDLGDACPDCLVQATVRLPSFDTQFFVSFVGEHPGQTEDERVLFEALHETFRAAFPDGGDGEA